MHKKARGFTACTLFLFIGGILWTQQPKPATSRQQTLPLAALAATGNSYALGQLWELNKGLLRSMFWKWYPAHKAQADAHGLTADDFEQEGFFAVQHAAQTYDPAQGAFTTWLTAAMQRQIQRTLTNGHARTVTGEDGRQHTTSADLLNHCTSLDVPLDDEDGGSATLGDLTRGRDSGGRTGRSGRYSYSRNSCTAALEEALAKLTDREADVLRRRYYQQQPLREVGEAYGVAWSRAQQVEKAAMRKLRRNPALCRFHDEVIQHHAYRGTSFGSWQYSGSVEEHLDRIPGKQGCVFARCCVKFFTNGNESAIISVG